MAFPQVASITPTGTGNGTTHNIAMPATVNAGDLLVTLITNDGADTITTPTSPAWQLLSTDANGVQCRLGAYYRIADGTEGGTTVNFATSGIQKTAAQVYRITGWHGTTPPEVGTAATGNSISPNPPTLSPSWGAADTLWIAVFGADELGTTTVYPANYTNGTMTDSAGGGGDATTSSARRELNAATEDPGTFTHSTEQWVAQTVAIRPSAGAPPVTGTIAVTQAAQTMAATGKVEDRLNNSFEGGSTGTAITEANSGGPSGDAFDDVFISGSGNASFAHLGGAPVGSIYAVTLVGSPPGVAYVSWLASWQTETEVWARFYFRTNDVSPVTAHDIFQLLSGSANAMNLQLGTTGLLSLRDQGSTVRYSSAAITANTWYRIEVHVVHSATVGHMEARLFTGANLHGTTPDATFGNLTDNWNLLANSDEVRFGVISTPGQSIQSALDEVGIDNTDWMGPATITPVGTIAVTQDDQTAAFSGTVANPITGTIAVTQADDTGAFTGSLGISGSIATTQDGDTGAVSGTVANPITGTIDADQEDDTGAVSGSVTAPAVTGTISVAQGDDTANFDGTVVSDGTLNSIQDDQTGAINGTVANPVSGSISATQEDDDGSFTGTESFTGTIGATQDDQTGAITGSAAAGVVGSISVTQEDDTGAFDGSVVPPAVTGTFASTQAAQTMAASGIAAFGVAGTISVTQDDDSMTSTGSVINPITGVLGATQEDDSGSFTGDVFGFVVGTIAVTQEDQTGAFTGTVIAAITGTLAATQATQTMTAVGSVVNLVAGAVVSVTCTIGGPTLACAIGGPTLACAISGPSATCTISPVTVIAGSNFIITATFRDAMGDLANPTTVSAVIQAPDETQTTPTPTSSSVGVWTTVVPTDQAGFWFYQITGAGNEIDVVCHGSVCVEPALVLV